MLETQNNGNNINYDYQSTFESYHYADLAGLDFNIDGSGGVVLFAKEEELSNINWGKIMKIFNLILILILLSSLNF